ncbi:hypothetical protein [Peribacillus frigoritolerans]|uniref:hypothetical protein n=1 Tax=Peribacillus frigoritolerans TaxID=450367 RepID=UPI0023DC5EF0|nr:hypothetical protein [Peribacillus frigoritolerans]MDF1995926.1 hypothetical protein [Peribacillus frigoritolerans]
MNKKNILLNIVSSLLCFTMFYVGMMYAEQAPLLILVGIVGLGGFSYLVSRIVMEVANQK